MDKMTFEEYQAKAMETKAYPNMLMVDQQIRKNIGVDYSVPLSTMMNLKPEQVQQLNNPYYAALGLAGEAGELCNKIKKIMRDKDCKIDGGVQIDIAKELGDVLWYAAALASEFTLNLSDVAEANIMKLQKRKQDGTIKGNGDDR